MNKIFLSNNYIIVDIDGEIKAFPKSKSEYSENVDHFILRSYPTIDIQVIPFSDSEIWFDEAGTTSFTESSLRIFLRENTSSSLSGNSITKIKSGNISTFTEDAFYNPGSIENPFLLTGDYIIDGENAKDGSTTYSYFDRHIAKVVAANGETILISGVEHATNKLNIFRTVFNGGFFDVIKYTKDYISTPSSIVVETDGQVKIRDFSVIRADRYTISFSTTNDVNTATEIYNGDGTDLPTPFEFNHIALTNDITYYYFIKAFGVGYMNSLTETFNATPTVGIPSNRLYIGGVGATISSASILATYLEEDDASALDSGTNLVSGDISNFIVDSNNNISAEIHKQYRLGFQAFNVNSDITYFIDLDGAMFSTNQQGFQACVNFKFFYSPTAAIRSTQTLGRNFRNIQSTLQLIYAPSDPVIGLDPTVNNQEYDLLTTGIEIFAHPDSETNNAGGVEADIQNAITQKSAVVTFVSDTISVPDSVSNLSVVPSSTTAVLNFTEPSSTNAILKYEVWIDGAFWDWINASGDSISGLVSATNYGVEIKTADNQYNISDLSNLVNFLTT